MTHSHRSGRHVLKRTAAAGAAWLLGFSLPCGAASANQLVSRILTPAYLDQAMCNDMGAISTQLFYGLRRDAGRNKGQVLSREQVREIATRFDAINVQLCAAVTPIHSDAGAWARKYARYAMPGPSGSLGNGKSWDGFLADGLAVKWADIAARFRTELLMLDSVINLELDLRPNAFDPGQKPLRDPHSRENPQLFQLLADIRRVSLTDEEAKVRYLLVTLHERKTFREMIPARFDLDGLARIEAKTRRLGLQLLDKYEVRLEALADAGMRSQLFAIDRGAHARESAARLQTAVRIASEQAGALISRYRRSFSQ
jgi:hypothetical protein